MIHLVLDTSIYRGNPELDSKEFSLLQRVASSGEVVLHVPYVVEREFVTQIEGFHQARLRKAIRAISNALSFGPHGPRSAQLEIHLETLNSAFSELVEERSAAFTHWLDQTGAIRHPLTLEQASNAMEAYFSGSPPLKAPKVRNHIPDSFIFQKVLELKQAHGDELGAVVEDSLLAGAFIDAGVRCWTSLREFLMSPIAQPLVAERVIADNTIAVYDHIRTLINQATDAVAQVLETALLSDNQALQCGDNFPGESGEIYLSGINTPYDVEIGDIEYIGGTVFLANVDALVELMYEFALPTFEALELDQIKFSVGPLNDHYLEVETTDEFRFSACLQIEFPAWKVAPQDIEKLMDQLVKPQIRATDLENFEIIQQETERP